MIEEWYTLSCDDCAKAYSLFPVKGDISSNYPAQVLMWAAEQEGWKVNRLARDIYYGKAWCPDCWKVTYE